MNIQQLQCFEEVFRERSMSRAAKRLYVSQPTVSNAIRELEGEFKVVLFLRKVPLVPTAEGVRLHGIAQGLLEHYDRALAEMRSGVGERKALRVGVSSVAQTYLQTFPESSEVYKGFNLGPLGFYDNTYLFGGVRSNLFDVALVATVGGLDDQDDLDTLEVARVPARLYVGRARPLAARASVAPHDLTGEPLTCFWDEPLSPEEHRTMLEAILGAPLEGQISFVSSNLNSVKYSVDKGNSSAVLIDRLFRGTPGIVGVPIEGARSFCLTFVWSASHYIDTEEHDFMMRMRELLAQGG